MYLRTYAGERARNTCVHIALVIYMDIYIYMYIYVYLSSTEHPAGGGDADKTLSRLERRHDLASMARSAAVSKLCLRCLHV